MKFALSVNVLEGAAPPPPNVISFWQEASVRFGVPEDLACLPGRGSPYL